MKKKVITSIIVVIVLTIYFINTNNTINEKDNYFVIENDSYYKAANDVIVSSCPGSSSCCESGYNVMCHMAEPLKNYAVTSQVCEDRGNNYHKGIDLVRTNGDGSIYAAFEGVVISTTNNNKNCVPSSDTFQCSWLTCSSTMGLSVTIRVKDDHFAGYTLQYMHMSSLNVKNGETVFAGQKIGTIGNTGCSTGEHLHFQINNLNGDSVVMNAFFLDKTLYACGGTETLLNKDSNLNNLNREYDDNALKMILRNADGTQYKGQVGKCPGSDNTNFFPGTELKSNGKIAYVYSVEAGIKVPVTEPSCGTGVAIITQTGEIHTYCHLQENSVKHNDGDYIESQTLIGIMGSTGDAKSDMLYYSVSKEGKYVDFSPLLLMYNGGTCENRTRKNCAAVEGSSSIYLCKNVLK